MQNQTVNRWEIFLIFSYENRMGDCYSRWHPNFHFYLCEFFTWFKAGRLACSSASYIKYMMHVLTRWWAMRICYSKRVGSASTRIYTVRTYIHKVYIRVHALFIRFEYHIHIAHPLCTCNIYFMYEANEQASPALKRVKSSRGYLINFNICIMCFEPKFKSLYSWAANLGNVLSKSVHEVSSPLQNHSFSLFSLP